VRSSGGGEIHHLHATYPFLDAKQDCTMSYDADTDKPPTRGKRAARGMSILEDAVAPARVKRKETTGRSLECVGTEERYF